MQLRTRRGTKKLGNFGIEIEFFGVDHSLLAAKIRERGIGCNVEGYNHSVRNHWKIVNDSSIYGNFSGELVSPILNGEEGLRQVEIVCEVLGECNAKVNRSCGLHVHHDAADFKVSQLKNFVDFYKKCEIEIDKMMPASRRGETNSYCKSVLNAEKEEFLEDRYYKVNLTSFYRHGTIEFRHHSGTVEFEKIKNWIIFTALIVGRCRRTVKINYQNNLNWREIRKLLGIDTSYVAEKVSPVLNEMVKYIETRMDHFANA